MKKILILVVILLAIVAGDFLYRVSRVGEESSRLPPFPDTVNENIDIEDPSLVTAFNKKQSRPTPLTTNMLKNFSCQEEVDKIVSLGKKATPDTLKALYKVFNNPNYKYDRFNFNTYFGCRAAVELDLSWCDLVEHNPDKVEAERELCRMEAIKLSIPYYHLVKGYSPVRFQQMLRLKKVPDADEWAKVYRIFVDLATGKMMQVDCLKNQTSIVVRQFCDWFDPDVLSEFIDEIDDPGLRKVAGMYDGLDEIDDGDPEQNPGTGYQLGSRIYFLHENLQKAYLLKDPTLIQSGPGDQFVEKTIIYSRLKEKSYCDDLLLRLHSRKNCGLVVPWPWDNDSEEKEPDQAQPDGDADSIETTP